MPEKKAAPTRDRTGLLQIACNFEIDQLERLIMTGRVAVLAGVVRPSAR
jgi:hypothetical protein